VLRSDVTLTEGTSVCAMALRPWAIASKANKAGKDAKDAIWDFLNQLNFILFIQNCLGQSGSPAADHGLPGTSVNQVK